MSVGYQERRQSLSKRHLAFSKVLPLDLRAKPLWIGANGYHGVTADALSDGYKVLLNHVVQRLPVLAVHDENVEMDIVVDWQVRQLVQCIANHPYPTSCTLRDAILISWNLSTSL